MLQDNVDLVGPVCEFVFGEDGSCIVGELGLGRRATPIVCSAASSDGWWFFNDANPCPNIATTALGRVAFCTTKPIVMEYARVFRDGNREEQLCVVVDMAATIFHEFTHVCLLNTDDANPRGCETSYLAENTFKWLLLRRYPGALNTGCCGAKFASVTDPSLPNPTLFMKDSTTTMLGGGACA